MHTSPTTFYILRTIIFILNFEFNFEFGIGNRKINFAFFHWVFNFGFQIRSNEILFLSILSLLSSLNGFYLGFNFGVI